MNQIETKPVDLDPAVLFGALAGVMFKEVVDQIKEGKRCAIASEKTSNGNRIRLSVVKIQPEE